MSSYPISHEHIHDVVSHSALREKKNIRQGVSGLEKSQPLTSEVMEVAPLVHIARRVLGECSDATII